MAEAPEPAQPTAKVSQASSLDPRRSTIEDVALEPADAQEITSLNNDQARVNLDKAKKSVQLRTGYGWAALALMGAQVVTADVGFFMYGSGNHWHIAPQAMDVWLAAAVVQVIGVVALITKSLFPVED